MLSAMAPRAIWIAFGSVVCLLGCFASPSKEDGTKFLEENKLKDGVVQLPSGLQYKVLKTGTGKFHPKKDSPCKCHYEGTLIDGTEFDSSYRRGQPATFAPNQVIKGWTEAMQLMVEGDKWQMFIPPALAYGEKGHPPKIPGGSTLIFTMEIVSIDGGKVPAVSASTPSDPAVTTSGGLEQKGAIAKKLGGVLRANRLTKIYSWNIFRYIGDYLHLFGIAVLLATIFKNRAVTGISKGSQILYLSIYCSRYLDLLDRSQASYLVFFKVTYIVTSCVFLGCFSYFAKSYEAFKDTAPIAVIYVPCVTAGLLLADDRSLMEICWTFSQFVEGFAMVPQYVFCYRDKGATDLGITMYVSAFGGYRVFYVLNWIYKKLNLPQYSDIISWMAGLIEVLFFIDFLMFRFSGSSMLRTLVLKLDEKVNLIQDTVEMKVLGTNRSSRVGAPDGDGLRRRNTAGKSDCMEMVDV